MKMAASGYPEAAIFIDTPFIAARAYPANRHP